MRFHPVTMGVSIALLFGTVYLFTLVPEGLPAERGSGRFNISTEAIQGITFDEMARHQLEVAAIVAQGSRRRRRSATTSAAARAAAR